jgi:hypothetical protein
VQERIGGIWDEGRWGKVVGVDFDHRGARFRLLFCCLVVVVLVSTVDRTTMENIKMRQSK